MRSLISSSLIARLGPTGKPFEIRDTRLKGFLLRVQPSGMMTYYVEYARGKRVVIGPTTLTSLDQARANAKTILADVYQGKDPAAARAKAASYTFEQFIDGVYAPWASANIRTAAATVARLKASFVDFKGHKLTDLSPWQIEQWRVKRIKSGIKASTANRELDDLKSALGKGVAWGILERNPSASVKRYKVDSNAISRFLSDGEETRLRFALDKRDERLRAERRSANGWRAERGYPLLPDLSEHAFADHLRPMVLLSLNTGLRQGELFSLSWKDIGFANANLTVQGHKAKSGKTRHVPLNAEALQILAAWRQEAKSGDGLVFPSCDGQEFDNVSKAWAGVLSNADITAFRWHDIRHTFASRLVMLGVDLNTVRELLGHADYKMTLRYAHLAPEHKAAAVAKLTTRQVV
jgi:integrase